MKNPAFQDMILYTLMVALGVTCANFSMQKTDIGIAAYRVFPEKTVVKKYTESYSDYLIKIQTPKLASEIANLRNQIITGASKSEKLVQLSAQKTDQLCAILQAIPLGILLNLCWNSNVEYEHYKSCQKITGIKNTPYGTLYETTDIHPLYTDQIILSQCMLLAILELIVRMPAGQPFPAHKLLRVTFNQKIFDFAEFKQKLDYYGFNKFPLYKLKFKKCNHKAFER